MRILEFFEGDNGELSMMRLLAFMSFFPSSSVLVASGSDTALGIYLAVYAAQTVGSKGVDVYMQKVKNATPKSLRK